MLSELGGRVAVVTGAGSGIGAALCRRLSGEGMRVVAADIDAEAAAATTGALEHARAVRVDVADAASVRALAEAAYDAFGQVDLLCNNAGVFQGGLSWSRSEGDWEWVFGVNVYGIVHGITAFVPRMIEQGTEGHVVNTASIASFVSGPYSAPYVVSKAAALSLSECLAHDLRAVDASIGVSVVVPSAIDTGIARTARVRPARYGIDETDDGAFTAQMLETTTGAGLPPDEVASLVVDAVRNDTFLVPTRPSYAAQLRSRNDALVARELPPMPLID